MKGGPNNMEFSVSKYLGFTDEEVSQAFEEEEKFEFSLSKKQIQASLNLNNLRNSQAISN